MVEEYMNKTVGEISVNAMRCAYNYLLNMNKDKKKEETWNKAIKKSCLLTNGLDEKDADYFMKAPELQRFFISLAQNIVLEDLYCNFIITVAFELYSLNKEVSSVSFGLAILDRWFEYNQVDYRTIRNQLCSEEIKEVVSDKERLYRKYFMMYNDPLAQDIVRVYYPKNGENWVSYEKKYSIEIKVNLSKGIEYGFCRTGFSYYQIESQGYDNILQIAYVDEDKEILKFDEVDISSIDTNKILWVL